MIHSLSVTGITASLLALTAAEKITKTNFGYDVSGVGNFSSSLVLDFRNTSSLADFWISDYTIEASTDPDDGHYPRTFYPSQIRYNPGVSMSLWVNGTKDNYKSQGSKGIPSAEIATKAEDILYGTVRTVLKAGKNPGACHGMFFYKSDNQETDIEILTSDLSKIQYTNQALEEGDDATEDSSPAPSDITDRFYEYRLDWLADRVDYYFDGKLVSTMDTNVPDEAGPWMWNNWSNGGPYWSRLPGVNNVDMQIQSITAYWNRTSVVAAKEAAAASSSATIKTTSRKTTTTSKPVSTTKSITTTTKPVTTTTKPVTSTTKPVTTTAKTSSVKSTTTTTSRYVKPKATPKSQRSAWLADIFGGDA